MHNLKQTLDLTKRIGQRLRAVRHAHQLSLADLSARTHSLSKSRISNYEQGLRRMGLEEAHALASALETVTPTYLLCLDDRGPFSARELELIDHFRRTDVRGQALLLTLAAAQPDDVARATAHAEGD